MTSAGFTPRALVPMVALACWPVWRWYVARMTDGSDEPLGVLALVAALLFLPRRGWRDPVGSMAAVAALASVGLYVGAFAFVPPLVRAGLAVCVLACVLPRDRSRPALPLFTLLMLSLPLIATLQYFLGFPLRAATAWISAGVLRWFGLAVESRGTVLHWAGEAVLIDAPCSGIRMLWTASAFTATLGCVYRLRPALFWRLMLATGAVVFLANVLRSVLLFCFETGLWPNPAWAHEVTGLGFFALAIGACLVVAHRLARCSSSRKVDRASRPRDVVPVAKGKRRHFPRVACALGMAMMAWAAVLLVMAGRAVDGDGPSVRDEASWPQTFEGRGLERVALHPVEERFGRRFPGAFAAFTDGTRRIVFRRINRPTRMVHPAAGCLRAAGYRVRPLPARRRPESGLWAELEASSEGRDLRVREQISDAHGHVWTDVSAWYWSALLHPGEGPWMAVTVIEGARQF